MPVCDRNSTHGHQSIRSRLGESLFRLQQHLNQSHHAETIVEDQFDQWQERWSDRRDQIARRLELIDLQLEKLIQNQQSPRKPQLSVVGAPAAEEHA